MASTADKLRRLAHDLRWLGAELSHVQAAPWSDSLPGLPAEGDRLSHLQAGVLSTAGKLQRELINTVRFDPARLLGLGAPLDAVLDCVASLLEVLDEIKQDVVCADPELSSRLRMLDEMVDAYLEAGAPAAA